MPRTMVVGGTSWRRRSSQRIIYETDSSSNSDSDINSSHSSEHSLRSRSSSSESQASPQPIVASSNSDSDLDDSDVEFNWNTDSEPGNSPAINHINDDNDSSSNDNESSVLINDNSNLSINNSSSDSDPEDPNHVPLSPHNAVGAYSDSEHSEDWDIDDNSLLEIDFSNHTTPPNRSPSPPHVLSPSFSRSLLNPTNSRPIIGLNLGNLITESDSDDSLLNFSPPPSTSSPGSRLSIDSDRQSIESHVSDSDDDVGRAFGEAVSRFSQGFDSVGNSPTQTSSTSSGTENHSAGTAASSSSVPTATMSGASASSVPFECSVCLEGLDGPASIDADVPGSSSAEQNPDAATLAGLLRVVATARISTGGRAGRPPVNARQRARGTVNDENANLTDVVATHCGHLYHQVCLLKWFRQQGRRTCPSCRKTVPASKLIRLYPNLSKDAGDANNRSSVQQGPPVNVGGNANVVNGPSTSTASSASSDGRCVNATCQDFKDIHNTLINDYSDLQERYSELRDNDAFKDAQISSLEEDNTRKENEIAQLKRELEGSRETVTASTSSSAKRRRR